MSDKNLVLHRGEQFKLENYTIEDDDGSTIDLTSANVVDAHLDVATHLKSFGETKIEKTGTDLSSSGNVDFLIDPSDTENLTPGIYLYEIWVEYDGDENYTAEVGKLFVKPRVDR